MGTPTSLVNINAKTRLSSTDTERHTTTGCSPLQEEGRFRIPDSIRTRVPPCSRQNCRAITSIAAKASDKIQHPFTIEILRKLGNDGTAAPVQALPPGPQGGRRAPPTTAPPGQGGDKGTQRQHPPRLRTSPRQRGLPRHRHRPAARRGPRLPQALACCHCSPGAPRRLC